MHAQSPRSQRRAYVDWVEARIEEYKETLPRARLLALADEVIRELQVAPDGQYQLTEVLLCHAIDRRLFRMLRLPGYRAWCAQEEARSLPPVISFPLPPRFAAPAPPAAAEEPTGAESRLVRVG